MAKSIRILGKQIPALLVAIALAGVASAGILAYYARIVGTATVSQSVVFSDGTTEKTYSFNGTTIIAGDTYTDLVEIMNRASVPATVKFDTKYVGPGCGTEVEPAETCEGITTKYYKITGYQATRTSVTYNDYGKPNGIDVDITVEDLGDAVKWTFDFPIDEDEGNGHMAYALVISLDGEHPAFQVHNNDGVCSEYPVGTHLYSEWDNGWHTSEAEWNTPVDEIEGIEATGSHDKASNQERIFTVTISKKLLGYGTFYWAAHFGAGGFYNYGGLSKYPEAWTPWSGEASAFEEAVVGEEIPEGEPFTINAGETLTFAIVNEFNSALTPGTYTIVTQIVPVGE